MIKLEKVKTFLEKNDYDLDKLKEIGFIHKIKNIGGDYGSKYGIYINYKTKVVVKYASIVNKNCKSKYLIPTIKIKEEEIFIQPLANRTEKDIKIAKEFFDNLSTYIEDYHDGNVGIYRNKPVLIDW